MNEENLINYYNKFNEDKRLTRRHGQVEFITTIKYIEKILEKIEIEELLDNDFKNKITQIHRDYLDNQQNFYLIFDELLYISFVNSFSNLSVRVALGIDFIIANLMIFNCSSVISPSSFKQLSTSLIFSSEYISLMLVRTGVIFSK